MTTITLEQTCSACPEQYWAKIGSHTIGYIRLRWGRLICTYLLKSEGHLSFDDIMVYEYTFDNEYKGNFDTEEEREYHLDKCKEVLLEKRKELKNLTHE